MEVLFASAIPQPPELCARMIREHNSSVVSLQWAASYEFFDNMYTHHRLILDCRDFERRKLWSSHLQQVLIDIIFCVNLVVKEMMVGTKIIHPILRIINGPKRRHYKSR